MNMAQRLIGGAALVTLLLLGLARPGYGWTQRSQVTNAAVDSSQPSAVRDSHGTVHTIWLQQTNGAEDVFYTQGDGVRWAAPQNLSHSADRSLSPALAIDDQDRLVALWVEIQSLFGVEFGSRLYYAVHDGDKWSDPQPLSSLTILSVGPPALAARGNEIHAVWAADTGIDGYGDAIQHAVWDGSTWTAPQSLPLQTGSLDAAALAFDRDGRMHLVWDGNTTGSPADLKSYQIYYARQENGGWTQPVNISHSDTYSFLSAIAIDGAGHPHVIWMEEDTNLGQGIHVFDRILYQRWDGQAWLPAPRRISVLSGAIFPRAVADDGGNVHFLWSNNTAASSGVNLFRLYSARWDGATLSAPVRILAAAASDSGQSMGDFVESASGQMAADRLALVWSGGDAAGVSQVYYAEQPPGQVSLAEVGTAQALADAPDLAGRTGEDLHAVWVQGTGPSDVLYSRGNSAGWSNPISISLPGFTSAWPAITLGPDDAPHVAWFAHDDVTSDRIYYTRLGPSGWLTPTLLSHEFDAAAAPDIEVDQSNDVHLVWEMTSQTDHPAFAIYYRRTTGGGASWSDWERISAPGHNANRPQLALDAAGHPHVVWYDVGEQEIYYATRTDAGWSTPENVSGTPALVTGATITSQGPSVAVDSSGQVHVAWMDSSGGLFLDSVLHAVRSAAGWQRTTLMARPDVVRDMDRGAGANVQVVAGPDGQVHILWHDVTQESTLHIYASNNLNASGWSLPTRISTDAGSAIRPAAVVDERGILHMLWSDFQQTRQIFYQRQERFDWLKVANEQGAPMAEARLFANGRALGTTDSRGLFIPDGLAVGDELTALAPAAGFAGVREHHTTSDTVAGNWAYRTYLTNWRWDAQGNRLGAPFTGSQGEQVLTVRGDSPLILFNLVVSLEWPAAITYTRTFSKALRLASDYLFDASNGQMALGQAVIYTAGQYWQDADIQVLAFNHNRPNADINGLRKILAPPERVGRSWSGKVGGAPQDGPWDQPAGYRTLIHEFGHYALGLWDSYLRIDRDEAGHQKDQVTAHCTGPEIQTNDQDAANATLMDYQYNASEFSMRDSAAWDGKYCTQTEQFARHGEGDWETMRRLFADTQTPARWVLQTPAETGVLAGPTVFPLAGAPAISIRAALTSTETPLVLQGPPDAIRLAAVTLSSRREGGVEDIDQGYTDSRGRITLLGARDGDEVRALSWDSVYSGRGSITAGVTNTLVLTAVRGLAVRAQANPRYLRILPRSDGRGVQVQMTGGAPGASLDAGLNLTGRGASVSQPMGYSNALQLYQATLAPKFSETDATLDGLAQITVSGVDVNAAPVYGTSLAAFYSLEPGAGRLLAAPDGRLRLLAPGDAAPATGSPVRLVLAQQASFAAGAEARFLSPVYEVRLGGALAGFAAPVTLVIHPTGSVPPGERPTLARFDEANRRWLPLAAAWDAATAAGSAAVTEAGFYSLIVEQTQTKPSLFLPLVMGAAGGG